MVLHIDLMYSTISVLIPPLEIGFGDHFYNTNSDLRGVLSVRKNHIGLLSKFHNK